jgi:hypothetical protein
MVVARPKSITFILFFKKEKFTLLILQSKIFKLQSLINLKIP